MKPCSKVGIDVTWRCNWKCAHCFYARNAKFHSKEDTPINDVYAKIDKAKANGLDHVVFVGQGEPSFCPNTLTIIDYAHSLGMATSIITNGSAPLRVYQEYYDHGLDHLHISSHGLGDTLDAIVGCNGAFNKQHKLKEWLKTNNHPFRTNVTLQQRNYKELPDLAKYEIDMGVHHFVFLGFLPHYEWYNHVREVAVHPTILRPFIEQAADLLIASNTLFTIRYHPFCHLGSQYWKYVVNARYIQYDPFEWNYELNVNDLPQLRKFSIFLGDSVANKCEDCLMRLHCGGWNRIYAQAFRGAELQPILGIPPEYQHVWEQEGGLHDMNPANHCTGTLCQT
ncbi:MAG: radical SAM protein [Methanomassiliicoccales archaeon]|jgi:MoaA/NifB/PqqE/SkfB family radical SAM enzyme